MRHRAGHKPGNPGNQNCRRRCLGTGDADDQASRVLTTIWWAGGSQAADLYRPSPKPVASHVATLPAVSEVNGKFEFSAGDFSIPTDSSGGYFRGGASLTAPLGNAFGIQGDVSVVNKAPGASFGSALHLFTRDPNSYLVGITAGFVSTTNNRQLGAVGPEAELYSGQWTLQGWAGVAGLDYNTPGLADLRGAFAMVDVLYYPTNNLKLDLGASTILRYNTAKIGVEYGLGDMGLPISLTADARYGGDGAFTITAGLKGYLGGDTSESLINRQRTDDPPNRALDLDEASGSLLFATPPSSTTPPDPEQACINDGGHWEFNGETYFCNYEPL
jgi:hypothetical protein